MAEEEIVNHTKAVYKAWKNPNTSWKHKLKEILIEVLIIVFAVSISIWFHNWSERWKDKKEEKDFLKGLKEDLLVDVKEMKADTTGISNRLGAIQYLESYSEGNSTSKSTLSNSIDLLLGMNFFYPRSSRFEALKSSGKLGIIENKKLLYNMTELYQKDIPFIIEGNNISNAFLKNDLVAYLEDHLTFFSEDSVSAPSNFFQTPKMKILLLRGKVLFAPLVAYSDAIDKSNEIIKQIDEELK